MQKTISVFIIFNNFYVYNLLNLLVKQFLPKNIPLTFLVVVFKIEFLVILFMSFVLIFLKKLNFELSNFYMTFYF